jgi:hypothetical protein
MSEDNIQMNFIEYLESLPLETNLKFSMIPNDTYTNSINQKTRNIRMGLRGGLPDLLICYNNKLFFIEFKTLIGRLTPKQEKWIDTLSNCNIPVFVCRSLEEAIDTLNTLH